MFLWYVCGGGKEDETHMKVGGTVVELSSFFVCEYLG